MDSTHLVHACNHARPSLTLPYAVVIPSHPNMSLANLPYCHGIASLFVNNLTSHKYAYYSAIYKVRTLSNVYGFAAGVLARSSLAHELLLI